MSKTPKLRFPEFSGEWEEEVLSKLGSFFKGAGLSKADLTNEGLPCILYGELYTKYNEVIEKATSKTKVNNAKLVKSMKNDVLIPSSGETAIDIATASCVQENDVILGGDLNIFRSNIVNGIFLSYQLNNSKRKEIAKLAQGASVVHLYNDSLKKIKINLPGQEEQQKIASFLSLVDKKIEKQSEKVEAIKEYKKGMMQKIFSREIRFKDDEGKEFPEWEEKKLGEVVEYISSGKTKDKEEEGKYKVYGSTGVIGITNKADYQGEHILIARVGANAGFVNIVDEECGVSDNTLVIKLKDNMKTKFLYYLLKNYDLSRLIFGSGQPLITGGQLKNINFPFLIKKEQQKIANFLSTIDKKLEKEEEKLEALRIWKKGLLQQMFV